MYILWFLIVGAVAGWLAGLITKGSGYGLLGNIILGIVGAIVGGFIFRSLGWFSKGTLGTIFMALIGALIVLFLASLFRRR